MQDHKVFAHHDKWGTFQIPKAFLNTNNNAPAAVAPKAVRQARGACMLPPWHGTRHALLGFGTCVLMAIHMPSALSEFLYISTPTLAPRPHHPSRWHSRRCLVQLQVSNGHGWHGARKIARAKEQQKQQEKQQQQQKLKHKQQQQQQIQQQQKRKQEQEQKRKRKQDQRQNGGGETGALSVDGVKACRPTICAHNIV